MSNKGNRPPRAISGTENPDTTRASNLSRNKYKYEESITNRHRGRRGTYRRRRLFELDVSIQAIRGTPAFVVRKSGTFLVAGVRGLGVSRSRIGAPTIFPLDDGKCVFTSTGVVTSSVGLIFIEFFVRPKSALANRDDSIWLVGTHHILESKSEPVFIDEQYCRSAAA